MSTINRVAHGLTASQRIVFSNLVGGAPIDVDTVYYVLAAGLTADAFQISETDAGTPLTFATLTSATMQVVVETTDTDPANATYSQITDPTEPMAPPAAVPTPSLPTVSSLMVSGIARLIVHLNDTAEAKVRAWEVQITHKYTDQQAIPGTATGVAATDLITLAAHGLIANDKVRFMSLAGGAGLTIASPDYFVIATGLTANDFKVSLTLGGAAVDFTSDISAATIVKVITTVADWTSPLIYNMPEGSTELSIPCLGSTNYNVRVREWDVYGNAGPYCTEATVTTIAGNDSLSASIALLANDVQDGIITESKILPGSITTPLLHAGAVTADILAATIVLSSLIKTGQSGTRRVEIDTAGIRLMDTDDSLIVNIPTNGDPVYFRGKVDADTLTVQSATALRTALSLESGLVGTLQNGVATPSTAPTMVAGVDSLTLGATPTNIGAGIGYDSGAGTFWVACDPTVSPFYVAQEFNATTGALVRSIGATGSIASFTTTSGSTSHISDTADGLVGSTDSHITTPMVMPNPAGATNLKITKVAVYMAGRSGTCSTRNGVWNTSNVNLRESATYTAASGGVTTVGASDLHNATLSSALAVTGGTTYRVGFRRVNSTDGSQHDKDDGSGKTTYSGDGTTADGTGWGTRDTAGKPNVYFTYTYDVDTRKETAKMIGVCTDGTYIYTLDTNGVVWKYDRTTLAWVTNSGVQTAISGTKAQAGLFYDAGSTLLVITTTTGTGAGVFMKVVWVTPSTLAVSATTATAVAGPTFSGTTDTFRGGARLNDPLNASAATYWIATTSAVYGYTWSGSTLTNTANRDFGQAITIGSGLTHDGTVFRGFAIGTPTKVWKFSAWDWTTASSTLWGAYSWYDSNATGGTHETAVSPRTSLVIRRREQVTFGNPAIPVGGTDDPDNRRAYFLMNATDTGAGTYWLQATGLFTSRVFTDYTGSGTHDGTGTAFPAGTPAQLKSAGTGFTLKGNGVINRTGAAFPASPVTGDHFYRSDIGMEFRYDGTRWLCTCRHTTSAILANQAASISAWFGPDNALQEGTAGIWAEKLVTEAFVAGGGTALAAGTHQWVGTLVTVTAASAVHTTWATHTINSGASTLFKHFSTVLNIVIPYDATNDVTLDMLWTKTGTPGNLTPGSTLSYRFIAV
jgi:hypothetical protein